jgi:hypothetical protein
MKGTCRRPIGFYTEKPRLMKEDMELEGDVVATKLDALGCRNNLGELCIRCSKVHII